MIRLHAEFDTEAEAIAWREQMYLAYHPAGYSTHIRIEAKPGLGAQGEAVVRWVAWGSRAESCD